jgi:hypothetical protein
MKSLLRSLSLRHYYDRGVESVLNGDMQDRFMFKVKDPDHPFWHPNYHVDNMYQHPFEDPHQSRRMIRGAFTLRTIGVRGIALDELTELSGSTEPVPDLIDLNEEPIVFSNLGVLEALQDLACRKLVAIGVEQVTPGLNMVRVLKDHPIQPTTVLMFDQIPSMRKAQEVHRIYNRMAGLA